MISMSLTMPHSIPVYKATGQTLRFGTANQKYLPSFVWNPSVDYSAFALADTTPIAVYSGEVDPSQADYNWGTPSYYWVNDYVPEEIVGIGHYVNVPWLIRINTKDGEAFIDMLNKDMTTWAGNDTGSTPYRIEAKDGASRIAKGFIGAAGVAETRGDELITEWTEQSSGFANFATFTSNGTDISVMEVTSPTPGTNGRARSNSITFMLGKVYRIHILTTRESGVRPTFRFGTSAEAYSEALATIGYGDNYYEFTATQFHIDNPYLWILVSTSSRSIDTTTSAKEKTEPVVTNGGCHIVSTSGGSTRNWTSIDANFDPNDIRSYSIFTSAEVLYPTISYKIHIRDIVHNTWLRGWIDLAGTGLHLTNPSYVAGIQKSTTGNWACNGGTPSTLVYLDGLSMMTELEHSYRCSQYYAYDSSSLYLGDTSWCGQAETYETTAFAWSVQYPPATAVLIRETLQVKDSIDTARSFIGVVNPLLSVFDCNRTDYEVYITLER